MIRTLAEPTLTAVSGETANFLAGGEFPATRRPASSTGAIYATEFKHFGVQLAFHAGRAFRPGASASRCAPSVSDVSGLPLTAIPSLSNAAGGDDGRAAVRRLLRDRRAYAAERAALPWRASPACRSCPILGALFSSKNFLTDESELVIIVTPYLVKPTSPQDARDAQTTTCSCPTTRRPIS